MGMGMGMSFMLMLTATFFYHCRHSLARMEVVGANWAFVLEVGEEGRGVGLLSCRIRLLGRGLVGRRLRPDDDVFIARCAPEVGFSSYS
jgi:hypothetical protein